jgi:hypothetical protein
MSDSTVPLTVVSGSGATHPWGQIGVGTNILTQSPQQRGFWFVVIDRSNLSIVYNQVQGDPSTAPNVGQYSTQNYILVMASLGMGLDRQPQGALFTFLDANGAGRELRRVEQVATQLNCGSLGTYGYALVSVFGNPKGFEVSTVSTGHSAILTVQLMPITIGGTTLYTPVQLSDA